MVTSGGVLTAEHVVVKKQPEQVRIKAMNGSMIIKVDSIDASPKRDLAMLHSTDIRKLADIVAVKKQRFITPKIGSQVMMIRSSDAGPLALVGVTTKLSKVTDEVGRELMLAGATYLSDDGDSGSPVFDQESGCIVGLHLKGAAKKGSENWFSPADQTWGAFCSNHQPIDSALRILQHAKNSFPPSSRMAGGGSL